MGSKTKNLLGNLTRSGSTNPNEENLDTSSGIEQKESQKAIEEKNYAIKTFVIYKEDFEFLKQFVDHKRYSGDIRYSLKESLHEAISSLREKTPKLLKKPAGR